MLLQSTDAGNGTKRMSNKQEYKKKPEKKAYNGITSMEAMSKDNKNTAIPELAASTSYSM
jgi:hypothetical protein